jgi:hypothetical protein
MILLIFLELIISGKSFSVYNDQFIFQIKCEDNKAKTGQCYYSIYDNNKDSNEYAIFDKCGKGKYCSDYGICIKYPEKIKNGKSCNYNEDCSSGSCINKKCGGAKEGEKCDNVNCEAGLTCYNDYSKGVSKCVQPAKEGTKPENTNCIEGLLIDNDGKCAKYGILDDGTELKTGNPELCKSGFAHQDKNYKYICDSIDTEPVCEKENVLKTKGKWKEGTEIGDNFYCLKQTDYNGVEKVYYRYSKLQSTLFGEFLDAYKELDFDKINSEGSNWFSGKVKEKYYLYEKAPALEAAGIINSQGKMVDDKKCEYEFMLKHLHSSFIKLKAIMLAMIALLF